MRLMRFPDIYGDQVLFTYASDLWVTDRNGGLARRLTSHPGMEQNARFSPDGRWIAFTGSYDGNPDVYVIPSEGGEPVRLTFESGADVVLCWTPDGRIAYSSMATSPGAFTPQLCLVSPKGGIPERTKLYEVADASFSPDGTKIAFDRNRSHNFNWRRYRGGTQGRVCFYDFHTGAYSEIPSGRENNWQPMWVGGKVYYISDKNLGTRNLYSYDVATKRTQQLTKFSDADIKWPSSDGKTIVFEKNGYLHAYDIASGEVTTINCRVLGDMIAARPQLRRLGEQITNLALSPSGLRLAVEARGEIFSVPQKNGETRNITQSPGSKQYAPRWSPDGTTIAYLSDESGEVQLRSVPQMSNASESKVIATDPSHRLVGFRFSPDGKMISYETIDGSLYVMPSSGGAATKILTAKYQMGNYDWSPDSKWIAYIDTGANLFGAAYLYEVASKKTYKITDGYYRDDYISFDLGGKYLYLVSSRTFNPTPGDFETIMQMENSQRVYVVPLTKDTANPLLPAADEEPGAQPAQPAGAPPAQKPEPSDIKIDLDGLAARALALPWPAGSYQFIVGVENGVVVYGGGKLMKYDLGSRQSMDLLVGPLFALDFNPKRTKIAFKLGPIVGVSDLRPGIDPNAARVNVSNVEAVIDPRSEWKQIFWEAWRWERDLFYDKDMAGVNWDAVGKQYATLLPFVSHRSDLNYVLGLMIAELGTGHAYVGGGDMGPMPAPIPTGGLGADYEVSGSYVRFKRIYRGLNFEDERRGPLGEPGINVSEGDYLLAIDGTPVTAATNPNSLLVNKVNRTVTLKVNSEPTMEGARTVRVRPVADESDLRYIEWVENNRKYVERMSGGKIGYMHVPNTAIEGMIEFIKGFYSQADKEAVIVDERFNGGGYIPTFFIEKLARKYTTYFRPRYGEDVGFPLQALDCPKVMLINEYAGSGGDLFPWLFRQAKLGPLIGMRTWGGLVGIQGSAPLVDGGFLTAPGFGLYDQTSGEWIAENKGVEPDIEVDNRPDLLAKGQDPQLDRAIAYLMDQLAKNPKRPHKTPPKPNTVGGGGGR